METPSQILSKLTLGNVLSLPIVNADPLKQKRDALKKNLSPALSILNEASKLDALSRYKSKFDYSVYVDLEKRFSKTPIRGGITFGKPIRLVNHHATCQQCLYSFEIDTYGRGCAFNCGYCYAKAQLTVHGYWNNPIPVPMDLNEIRKTFYTVFETDRKHKYREIFQKRIPLRIGSMSDSFMPMDKKYRVTLELLRLLKFYNYPYIVFTRSDLVSHEEYLELIDPTLASVQMSISSINDEMAKKLEPGAPSSTRRLLAVQQLTEAGVWTTVRLNPLFPIYPDGYFSDPNFKWKGEVPKFEFSSFDMVKKFSEYKVPSMLVGFARLSSFALNNIKRSLGVDLRAFYRRDLTYKSARDWHYTDAEVDHYYRTFKTECNKYGIEFTTCYIGNGESHFWKHQDLWSNKKDCCNAKGRIANFKTDCRQIPFAERLRVSSNKSSTPSSSRLHESLGTVSTGLSVASPQPNTDLPAST
jgi:DNA repair photolyase